MNEVIVVTDNGRPVVEMRRYRDDKRSPLERLKGSVVEYISPMEPVKSLKGHPLELRAV